MFLFTEIGNKKRKYDINVLEGYMSSCLYCWKQWDGEIVDKWVKGYLLL